MKKNDWCEAIVLKRRRWDGSNTLLSSDQHDWLTDQGLEPEVDYHLVEDYEIEYHRGNHGLGRSHTPIVRAYFRSSEMATLFALRWL
jgi:hypothetical protein